MIKKLVPLLAVALSVSVVTAGCDTTTAERLEPGALTPAAPSGEPSTKVGPGTQGPRAAATLTPMVSVGYSGAERTFVVPEGITSAQVRLAGGAGGSENNGAVGGLWLAEIPLTSGARVGAAVGGRGEDNHTDKAPGAGGWGLVADGLDLRGGPGGHSVDAEPDGPGGGGASAVRVDGVLQLVAAGGGGVIAGSPAGYGVGGYPSGTKGYVKGSGRGGGPSEPHLRSAGADAKSFPDDMAGAGGGGGYYPGEGGGLSGDGGGGGGYAAPGVAQLELDLAGLESGWMTLAWKPGVPTLRAGVSYELHKAAAPTDQLLQVNNASTREGGLVDTSASTRNDDQSGVVDQQLWRFVADQADGGFGQLLNVSSGKCLDYNDNTGGVDQWTCDASDGQPSDRLWRPVENSFGGTAFVNKTTGKYLATTVEPSAVGNLTTVQLDATASDRSTWLVYPTGPTS